MEVYIESALQELVNHLGGIFAATAPNNASDASGTEKKKNNKSRPLGPEESMKFLSKKLALDPLSPVNPTIVAEAAGVTLDIALTELLYASQVGLVSIKFAPECTRCGGAVCTSEWLSYYKDSTKPIQCTSCTFESYVN